MGDETQEGNPADGDLGVYCVQFGIPQYEKNVELLESLQRGATKMVNGLEGKTCEEQLKLFGLFRPEQRS